jgi:allophanate hydrolase subunit 2
MTALRILDAAPGLSLQDTGRAGWRRFGVSTAGAMDRLHLAAANRLVGNPPQTAALETVLAGFRFKVEAGPLLLAVAGPGMTFQVDGQPVPAGQSALAADGQVVSVSPVREGVYGYLAVAGGFAQAEVMGSRSAHRRSGIGAIDLAPGTSLAVQAADSAAAPLRLPMPPAHGKGPIRVSMAISSNSR